MRKGCKSPRRRPAEEAWFLVLLLASAIVIWFAGASAYSREDKQHHGKHIGELKFLKLKVVYTNPYFITPDGYAGYYIALPMTYEVHLTNTGKRTYKRLTVTAIHEYYESGTCDRWWYPHPREAEYKKGEVLPGDSTEVWEKVELGPGETVILYDSYTAPLETCAGLDQTHIMIKHTNEGGEESALFYDEPEAGVYCPPPPGTGELLSGSSGRGGRGSGKDWPVACGSIGLDIMLLLLIPLGYRYARRGLKRK